MKFFIVALCCVAMVSGAQWLEPSEAGLVKDSWNKVKSNEVDILYVIFKENPDIQAKFSQFAGQNLDELKPTPAFKTHAGRIIGLVSTYVGLIGDDGNDGKIKAALTEMGKNHAARGVSQAQLKAFQKSAVGYLKSKAGVSGDSEKAWNLAFDKMYGVIFPLL